MDSEQVLLNMFKKQHYDASQHTMQKIIMALSIAASIAGAILMSIFHMFPIYTYVFLGSIVVAIIMLILAVLKIVSLNFASFIYLIYACFLLIPVLWIMTGIMGAAPLISITLLIGVISMFSGRMLVGMLSAYLLALFSLTLYSIFTEIPSSGDIPHVAYSSAAYLISVILITTYTLSKQKRYEDMNDEFLRSSFKDDLTRVYNRKILELIMKYEESLYKKEKSDYIFVMIDVDGFKNVNDKHGHIFGDLVLRNVAKCISSKVRSSDFVVRYGGDEFLVIQTNATEYSLKTFLKRVKEAMQDACAMELDTSLSFGYAARSECETQLEALHMADQRLYEMKGISKRIE